MTRLYIELLKRAVDKERCREAHPAFVKIIEQLSPDEALVLFILRQSPANIKMSDKKIQVEFPFQQLSIPGNGFLYFTHLDSLGLVDFPLKVGLLSTEKSVVKLTLFGSAFAKAVIPDGFASLFDLVGKPLD